MTYPDVILFDDIQHIQYNKGIESTLEEAIQNGSVSITLFLKNGKTTTFDKPIKVQRENALFFLKVPNPGLHKPEIAYIEAALAKLGAQLLPQHGILVPKYEIIDIALDTPEGKTTTPCCLIEALEGFIPFGECGTDIQADSGKVCIADPDKIRNRQRQLDLLYSPAFAAFSAFCHLIGNNDPHQENFGTAIKNGRTLFAALDFDMAPMPFLTQNQIFGPYNSNGYPEEEYNLAEGGRHTPLGLDFSTFPVLSQREDARTPDNWVTTWCMGYGKGFQQRSPEERERFKRKVAAVFEQFATLDPYMFSHVFQDIEPRNPSLIKHLTDYFELYIGQLKDALKASNRAELLSGTPLDQLATSPHRPSALSEVMSNSFFAPPSPLSTSMLTVRGGARVEPAGNSPDMAHVYRRLNDR